MLKTKAKKKSRGVVYVVWDYSGENMEIYAKLVSRSARSVQLWTNLPTHIITDKFFPKEYESNFDSVVKVDWGEQACGFVPKAWVVDTPFDQTLFLDADTLVMDNLEGGFDKLNKHGLCLSHAPVFNHHLYNSGVIWFDKTVPYAWEFMKIWSNVTKSKKLGCNEQQTINALANRLNLRPYVLPHSYNFRAQFLELQWLNGPMRILHWSGPEPLGHAQWRYACKKTAFCKVSDATGPKSKPKDKHFVYLSRWVCTRCGHKKIADNRHLRPCDRCNPKVNKNAYCHMVYPEYWDEFDKISTAEESLQWTQSNPNKIILDNVFRERETEPQCI